ncbi:MAG: SDR family oxidoreductase [Gemmatimonadota bacterium]
MISLSGRKALVTGGSRGIGRATAMLLARAGADVGITYLNREDAALQVVQEVGDLGRKAYAGGGDLADPDIATRLVDECYSALGGLDIFVGNAGIWPPEEVPLEKMAPDQWRKTLGANLESIFASTGAALRRMQSGSVVLVASTAGQRGEAFHSDYAASKGAIISLTKSLCIECAPRINVNCVAPGWVLTDMSTTAYGEGGEARIAATIPLQRIATAEDIAGPIVFLCSDLARHMTGEIVNVNGGSVLCG